MKISNSKKQLARIISENGGWPRNADWAAQCKSDSTVSFYYGIAPYIEKGDDVWYGDYLGAEHDIDVEKVLPNWHKNLLSRDEYFHLYPAPDDDGWGNLGSSVARDIQPADGKINTGTFGAMPPLTIEQLAADYRAKLAIAQQAQEEADSHRCGAGAALEKLVAAGKALGLVLGVAVPEPELVITDWRDLRDGDVVELTGSDNDGWLSRKGRELTVRIRGDGPGNVYFDGWCMGDNSEWRFIRRPTKGDADA